MERMEFLIADLDRLIPPMKFRDGNPNNGLPHHRYAVGNEGSRVLYLTVRKAYLKPDFDYEALKRNLERVAKAHGADETWPTEDDPYTLVYRIWWD